jgi:hypothetical protein
VRAIGGDRMTNVPTGPMPRGWISPAFAGAFHAVVSSCNRGDADWPARLARLWREASLTEKKVLVLRLPREALAYALRPATAAAATAAE